MSDNCEEKNTYSMTMFYTDDAKTLFGKNGLLLGDFTLKVIGEMKLAADGKSGHWVCSCGTKERGIVVTRTIVLNVNCFDTKKSFVDALRKSYGGGTFFLGPRVTASTIQLYATSLKSDYEELGNSREFYDPQFMGYQGEKYWLISSKLHILDGKVLSPHQFKYIPMDNSLDHYSLEINQQLLISENLKIALKRFHDLAEGFGQNDVPFQMATAFTLGRLVRNALNPDDVWTESSIGMIFSETKCIGKSLSLFILALGQGIPSRVHLMFLSGGNQLMCGTSAKKMQQSLARTTGVVMIDDPDINKPFGEFLLQVQGRLISGSNKEGMSAPRGAALISSNSPELARNLLKNTICDVGFS